MFRIFFIFFILAFPLRSWALIEVDITRGNLNPLPVAVSPMSIDENSRKNFEKILNKSDIGSEISAIVENNLRTSGLFNPLNKDAFLQAPDIANLKPRFEDWSLIKAQALITGKVNFIDKKLRVEFRLWDVLAGKEILALAFTTVPTNWRRVGHIITDKVYERLTGEKGYFDTRIIYVAEEGPKTKRVKKLAIMDQDGANNKFLTLGNELVLTPRFNPTSQMVTYLSYFRNLPRVYLLDIETGMQEVVGDFPGMTFAPRSSPSYSPDGKYICFNSDRSGYQQIYVMKSDGSSVKRISFGTGLYGTPVWSPRGDLIAFTKLHKGKFYIGVMRTDGSGERLLTENFYQEAPSWSPNGRVLIFYRETKTNDKGEGFSAKLWSIDLTGYNERLVNTPSDASDPSWSSLLSN